VKSITDHQLGAYLGANEGKLRRMFPPLGSHAGGKRKAHKPTDVVKRDVAHPWRTYPRRPL
jgi:hypothetical protein